MSGGEPRVLADEHVALRRVATLVARGVPPEEVFASVAEELERLFLSDGAALARFESDGTFTIVASAGELFPVGSRWPIEGKNVATTIFETGSPARIDNLIATGPLAARIREAGVRSSVGAPIIVEGHLWGIAGVVSTRETLPPDTEARLAGFTDLVAMAIANAEGRAGLAKLAEEQEALRRVATLVARSVPPEEVFASVTAEVERLLLSDLTNLTRFESDRTFTILASAHERFPVGSRWPIGGKNVTTAVFETGRSARIDNFNYTGPLAHDIHEEIRSAVGSPIIVEGRLWGAIGLGSTGEQPLPPDTEARLAAFTELVAMAIANAQSRAALLPVEGMRSQAEQITERELSTRLPVADDTGEVTALGRTLNSMLDRVEEAVARERRVVSDASHELRTPLTTLRAEVDLALMGDRDKAELRAALESASEEARRMTRLADDLLVLARADQGRLPLHPRPLPARELLEDAARRVTPVPRSGAARSSSPGAWMAAQCAPIRTVPRRCSTT
ncbi:MAG: GAF domain-containing protein [Solirubrobacteraceae bacterium]